MPDSDTPQQPGDQLINLQDAQSDGLMVAILMCTYNGDRFLAKQLESLAAQTHKRWILYVSDDGSTDSTNEILLRFERDTAAKVVRFQGPRQGFAANFMSLLRRPEVKGDLFAFSDQDDVWFPDKLERGISSLRPYLDHLGLYCSRTQVGDENGLHTGFSPLFEKQPSFQNALVQSIAGANTMLMTRAARQLVAQTPLNAKVITHDWLAYLLVSACGGHVTYDPIPTLLYRQHSRNLIGANTGLKARSQRLMKMLGGRFAGWNEENIRIIEAFEGQMKPAQRKAFISFKLSRNAGLFPRIKLIIASGVYRQTLAGNISLAAAVVLKRF
jgi:glycosyltransferase involved in cell wall biosynthesis